MATVTNKSGTSAADTIKITESDLTINAGEGNDKINLVSGSRDVIRGNAGDDTIVVENSAGTGNKLYGDTGDDILNAKASSNSVIIYGGDGADKIYGGSAGGDKLYGLDGNDRLEGGAGDDYLRGGAGDDYLWGGLGNDTLVGDAGKDRFVHYKSNGNDTIKDYEEGEDTVELPSGDISKTALVNNGKDVKFTIDSGSVTVCRQGNQPEGQPRELHSI